MLEAFDKDNQIRAHNDYFDQGISDIDLMQSLKKWTPIPIFISADSNILRNKVESQVLRECNLSFVCLARGWGNIPWPEFAWKIVKAWPGIVQATTGLTKSTIFNVHVSSLKTERYKYVSDI